MVMERLGIHRPYFLAVGSVSPRKNFARLLQAWSQLGDIAEMHSLVVVGRTHQRFSGNGRMEATVSSVKHIDRYLVPIILVVVVVSLIPVALELRRSAKASKDG